MTLAISFPDSAPPSGRLPDPEVELGGLPISVSMSRELGVGSCELADMEY